VSDQPKSPPRKGAPLPFGTARWDVRHRRYGDGETCVVIAFYDADGVLIEENEY